MAASLTTAELIEVWRRVMDPSYTVPLEEATGADAAGFDVIQSIVAMLRRASSAIEITTQAMYVYPHSEQSQDPAAGGVQATGNITISRSAPTDGDLDLIEGDRLFVRLIGPDGQEVDGPTLELAAPVTMPSGSSGPIAATVRAARSGWQGNVADSRGVEILFTERTPQTMTSMVTTGFDNTITDSVLSTGDIEFSQALINSWVVFTAGPNTGLGPRRITSVNLTTNELTVDGAVLIAGGGTNDLSIVDLNDVGLVAELNGIITGGVSPWLDYLARERGIARGIDEDDAGLRERVRALPDVVSRNAIYRAASRILTPLGIPFRLFETRNPSDINGAAWDLSPFDDTGASILVAGRQNLWCGDGFEYRGFYIIVERQWYGDFGAPFGIAPPGLGAHPSNAWDHMFYDGYPLGFYNDLTRLVTEIEKTRAAGVPWLLVLVDSIP